MSQPHHQVRRATVEDLPKLSALWKVENLPGSDLEQRFKEFQVVQDQKGELIGALGMRIAGQEGLLHSEAFAHAEQAEELRALLWDRVQKLIANHGLARIWTQLATPFWHTNGFQETSPDALASLPPTFTGTPHPWLCLQLKEIASTTLSIDKEFALFKEAEHQSNQQLFRHAKTLRTIAALVAIVVLVLVVIWAFSFFKLQGGR